MPSNLLWKWLPKGTKDNSATPSRLFSVLDSEFHFDFDPCPLNENPSVNGLEIDWGQRTYVNPPFSKKGSWVKKAIEEQNKGKLVVMLLPVDTSTKWFHDFVLPNAEVRWIRGRLKNEQTSSPWRFASMIVIFRPKI